MTRSKRQKRLAAARAWQAIYDLGYVDGHHAGGDYDHPHSDAINPHLLENEEIENGVVVDQPLDVQECGLCGGWHYCCCDCG